MDFTQWYDANKHSLSKYKGICHEMSKMVNKRVNGRSRSRNVKWFHFLLLFLRFFLIEESKKWKWRGNFGK